MGLDMYLEKRTYVKNWDHMASDERHTVTITGPRAADVQPELIGYVCEDIAYWRKANAIHAWFVNQCQDGIDDCRYAYVSRDALKTLVELCQSLLAQHDTDALGAVARASDELPPQSGFFFGSTDIDAGYWQDLRETVDMLAPELARAAPMADYYYHSSW